MIHYHHENIQAECARIERDDLDAYIQKIHFMMGAITHLQSHCSHLEEVLRANNITMPAIENKDPS